MATRLIGLAGKAGSGKTEVSRYLCENHGFHHMKFAGPLKSMIKALFWDMGYSESDIYEMVEGNSKQANMWGLSGNTPRNLMQTLGTEWGRDCLDKDFWVNITRQKIITCPGPVVIDDTRFDNEAEMIRDLGGVVVQVDRPSGFAKLDVPHSSEDGITDDLISDYIINNGSLDDLTEEIEGSIMLNYA